MERAHAQAASAGFERGGGRTADGTASGLAHGDVLSVADLAADIERNLVAGRKTRPEFHHVSVIAGDRHLAEAHPAHDTDHGNLRPARPEHPCGPGHLE